MKLMKDLQPIIHQNHLSGICPRYSLVIREMNVWYRQMKPFENPIRNEAGCEGQLLVSLYK